MIPAPETPRPEAPESTNGSDPLAEYSPDWREGGDPTSQPDTAARPDTIDDETFEHVRAEVLVLLERNVPESQIREILTDSGFNEIEVDAIMRESL